MKEIINEYKINRNINIDKSNKININYENKKKGKIMEIDNYNSIPYTFLYPKNKEVYIKKNVKYQRNYSYTNRNKYLSLNNRNEILNNRMVIQKLLEEEE